MTRSDGEIGFDIAALQDAVKRAAAQAATRPYTGTRRGRRAQDVTRQEASRKRIKMSSYPNDPNRLRVRVSGGEPVPTETRQRMDYRDNPDGSSTAILTITLPGGITKRFEATTTDEEAQEASGEIVGAELAMRAADGVEGLGEVGWNPFKAVAKLAKKVASSKVFALAATGLAMAAPLLGPLAPAALGAAAGMGVASKLAKAGVAAAKGAGKVAKALTNAAAKDAVKLTKTAKGAAALLATANKKRLGAEALANATKKRPSARAKPITRAQPATTPVSAPGTDADLLTRARAGRVRSNQRGTVTTTDLLTAHKQGRIYWVQ